jgi:fused signal recognition particle receptor
MTTSIVIVIALVVIGVAVFAALARSKASSQLQAPPSAKPLSGHPPPPPSKRPPSERPPTPPRAEHVPSTSAHPPPPAPSDPRGASVRPPSAQVRAAEAARVPSAPSASTPSVPPAKRDVAGLRKGLAATRGGFVARLTALFQGKKEIDPAILEQVEEVMLASDVGPKTTQAILARLRGSLERNELHDADAVWTAVRAEAARILGIGGGAVQLSASPTVVLMVGVNGVGKTTTIGKLATRYQAAGKKVLLAAGDTFRAAAVQQLEVWGKRVGSEVVRGKEGADPAAVAFDATNRHRPPVHRYGGASAHEGAPHG